MAKAYEYHFRLSSGTMYVVYTESREHAEECIKHDLGAEVKYEFVERKRF